ncbi:aspartyl protease family protein [Caulobacter sp. KR2-114]|uniref:aspartyl protease family protein n=1 Tax=Caulobacter sp. KR2-114 TaxID=3400912 RepID=UPI003BFAA24D
MRRTFRRSAAVLATGLALAGGAAQAKCHVDQIAELPVTMSPNGPLVSARINGHDVQFVADSGAFYSLLSPGAAHDLGLKLEPAPFATLRGAGGETDVHLTTVKTFTLAGVNVSNVEFLVGGGEVGGVGLMGQNVLGLADTEYDLAGGAIRLMKPVDCGDRLLAYWAGPKPISTLRIEWPTPIAPHTFGEVWVNGVRMRAMFDTGAGATVLTVRAAARAGIRTDSADVKAAGWSYGIGHKMLRTWVAPIADLKVGDEEIHNTRVQVGDLELADADMLVGADFFLSHRVWVSKAQHRMVFTYNGGPVFNLAEPARMREIAGDAPARDAPTVATTEKDPTDAEGFSRRGAAFAARRAYDLALADFDQACKLAPGEPRYFYQRAMAHLGNRQPLLAMSDLDTVLKLKPGDVDALLVRAEFKALSRDEAGARADLAAAASGSATNADIRLKIAGAYGAIGAYEAAIPQLDLWIDSHRDDARQGEALNNRCWARAVLGRELDKALADCNAALGHMAKAPAVLDSRGLVRLRMGQWDKAIADYDTALAQRPDNAWSLYGRGVARQHKGLKAEGDADIAAALKLRPHLEDQIKRFGIDVPSTGAAATH